MTIEERLSLLERRVADLDKAVFPPPRPLSIRDVAPSSARGPARSTEDRDPTVKILPRNWTGPDFRGRRFSETTAQFMGMTSHMLDTFATKNAADPDPERQKYARWDAENAEAARQWRARLEAKEVEVQP